MKSFFMCVGKRFFQIDNLRHINEFFICLYNTLYMFLLSFCSRFHVEVQTQYVKSSAYTSTFKTFGYIYDTQVYLNIHTYVNRCPSITENIVASPFVIHSNECSIPAPYISFSISDPS